MNVAAGVIGGWNTLKKNSKTFAGISNKIGNWIQKKLESKDDDAWYTKAAKAVGNSLNELVFDPDAKTAEDNKEPIQQVKYNANNASYQGAPGYVYGTLPQRKLTQNTYVNTDWENLARKYQENVLGRSSKLRGMRRGARVIR